MVLPGRAPGYSRGAGVDLDDTVCLCFHVTRRKVVNFVRHHRPAVASQISECGSAGTGCGWCIPFLKQIHRHGTESVVPVTPEEYARLRAVYLRDGHGVPPEEPDAA